ncbi:MAG: potassium-transporting ATPase subunit F [Pyrinomonadaceae bacterium]
MADIVFITATVLFFLLALLIRARGRAGVGRGFMMGVESIVLLVVAALLLVYLAYARLRPEKF